MTAQTDDLDDVDAEADELRTSEIDVESLPWKTAPEFVDEIVDRLGFERDDQIAELARRLALEHGTRAGLDHTPKTIAASAVYAAGLLVNDKQTQSDVGFASGVSPVAIRGCYPKLVEAEGIPTEQSRAASDEGSGTLLARLRRWFR